MSGEKSWFWYFILGIIYLAILYVLVKPGSQANAAVVSLGQGLADLVTTAVGGTASTNGGGISLIPTGGSGGTLT